MYLVHSDRPIYILDKHCVNAALHTANNNVQVTEQQQYILVPCLYAALIFISVWYCVKRLCVWMNILVQIKAFKQQ